MLHSINVPVFWLNQKLIKMSKHKSNPSSKERKRINILPDINLSGFLRSLARNLKHNLISILGMSLAFMVAIFISIYVHDQLSVDKSQSNYDRIYRLEKDSWALMAGGVPGWVTEQFPEVESYARIGGTYWESVVEHENEFFSIENVLFIDGQPFDVFDFEFRYGDPATALEAPNAVILTSSLARRIFGDENPVGKQITYNSEFPLQVTAVIEDKRDIHIRFDMLINFGQLAGIWYDGDASFMTVINGSQNYQGYLLVNTTDISGLVSRINAKLIETGAYNNDTNQPEYGLLPFGEIYFSTYEGSEHGVKHGNKPTVIALIFVAIFILLIATINYINLTAAEGITRAKEIGLRKLLGSGRGSLFLHFIAESVFICMVSMVVAILLVINLYSLFQAAIGIGLPTLRELSPTIYIILAITFLIVSLAGGIYPAFYLSSLNPGTLFMTSLKSGRKGLFVRRVLIYVQFTIAIFLTIQSLAIFRQYAFMKNTDTGIDTDKILVFELPDYLLERSGAIRESLLEYPDITGVSFSLQALGNIRNTYTLNAPVTNAKIPFKMQFVDPEHFEVLGLDIISGRKFDRERAGDRNGCWIINETGARSLGFDPPESITDLKWNARGSSEYDIIGVVKDYHFNALDKPIVPTILLWREGVKMVQMKFSTNNIPGVLDHLKMVWSEFEPSRPLNYSLLDEKFEKHYSGEQKQGRLIGLFTIIALFIGCFGVFGMSAFMAKQMSKSITLRKVLGADTSTVVEHFSKEYFWLIIFAGVTAIPLSYLYIVRWLERFPYKTDIGWWMFAVALVINLLIAISTIAYHAFKTARLNPAEVLRFE